MCEGRGLESVRVRGGGGGGGVRIGKSQVGG